MTDEEDFSQSIRVSNSRGHASWFAKDTTKTPEAEAYNKIVDVDIVRTWLGSMLSGDAAQKAFVTLNANDPPDCYVAVGEHEFSLELTELVDQHILSQIKVNELRGGPTNSSYGELFMQSRWPEARIKQELQRCVIKKDEKYVRNQQDNIDVLLIYSSEPQLFEDDVKSALKGIVWGRTQAITSAYLLLGYRPGDNAGYPVFHLFGPGLKE